MSGYLKKKFEFVEMFQGSTAKLLMCFSYVEVCKMLSGCMYAKQSNYSLNDTLSLLCDKLASITEA